MASLTIVQSLATLLVVWATWKFVKFVFTRDPFANVPGPPSDSWLLGASNTAIRPPDWGSVHPTGVGQVTLHRFMTRITGSFTSNVWKSEQHIYEEPPDYIQTNRRLFGKGIVAVMGNTHKRQRRMLTPVFSNANLRDLSIPSPSNVESEESTNDHAAPTFHTVARRLKEGIAKQISQGTQPIDMRTWMARTALEVIGQCGFGHSFDQLGPNTEEHPVGLAMKNLFRAAHMGPIGAVKPTQSLKPVLDLGFLAFQRAVRESHPMAVSTPSS
ncbi:hypothetical protein NMY22_g8360 [Coprinellus aureogranulatus]|nr:hypothetical protein NMY22_g8360 [Coprinellus aureogranulatus]